jgi:hypothetical protein
VLQRVQAESTASQSPGRPAARDGDGATTRQIARRLGRCRARNSANARQIVRGSASQLLSSIEVVEGDRGFWLKLPRTLLARSSQLRRGRSGEPGGKGEDSRQKGRMRMKREHRASRRWRLWGCWRGKKKEEERAMDDARFLYPAKAALGPCARLA